MSQRIAQPVTQVRLTNVAVVRLRRAGKRFEVACYKNKVVSWRNGLEDDLDEVLQIPSVFQNVSKGVIAKNKDLKKAFGTTDHDTACVIILEKGQVQVSEKERAEQYERTYRDVATIIAGMCVNRESKRPYTVSMIVRAMKDVHFAVNIKKSPKLQAMKCIEKLKTLIPIERAQMKLQLMVPANAGKRLKERVKAMEAEIIHESWSHNCVLEVLVLPGAFRPLHELVQELGRGQGSVEVLEAHVQAHGEAKLEDETERLNDLKLSGDATAKAAAAGGEDVGAGVGAAGAGDGATGGAAAGASAATATPGSEVGSVVSARSGGSRGKRGKKSKGKRVIKCGTCRTEFSDPADHRTHCKSDWHRFNLKRKLRQEVPVSEEEFVIMDAEALDEFFSTL